jgi:hypothetical protein
VRARNASALTTFLALPLLTSLCLGWGNEGHVYINQVATAKIPNSMPGFMRGAENRIAYLGPEPDRWRENSEYTLKDAQEPDHFIDLERLDGFGELPEGRYEFIRRLYEKRATVTSNADDLLPEQVGLLPYATIEVYDRLKVAFREYRKLKAANQPTEAVGQNIVFYAGWLSHYVGDGSQPLHTTISYNGWVGPNPHGYRTEPGIHFEFETQFISRNVSAQDFAGLVHGPVRLTHPFEDYMQYLRESHALVERLYQLEKAGGFQGAGSKEALEFTEQRLAAGSQMLLNLWYTAWLESAN